MRNDWPERPPNDPALPGNAPLSVALTEALRTLGRQGVASLPKVVGLQDTVALARWLYRGTLTPHARWAPFVYVDGHQAGFRPERRATLLAALSHARDGWLFLGAPMAGDAELLREANRGARVLIESTTPATVAPPGFVHRLRALDALHGVASDPDPALRQLRIQLGAMVRASGRERRQLIHLCGPVGSGRASLARWAHLSGGAQGALHPLDEAVAIEPAACWLARDVDVLSANQRAALCVALSVEPPSQAPYSAARRPQDPESERAFAELVGEGPAMAEALQQARMMGPDRRLNVLIQGEPGVGKEGLARALHQLCFDADAPFIAMDMASRNDGLIEAELFGVLKGAYTGATKVRRGAARAADGGTLFLDEIGNVSLSLQAKLLRMLQEREVVPIGGDKPVKVTVRVVAATNAELQLMVGQGRFRADLLDRLSGALIQLPPLREHPEDIPITVSHILKQISPKQRYTVSPEAMSLLCQDRWEGNVRALQSALRRAVNRAAAEPSAVLHPRHLDEGLRSQGPAVGYITSSQPDELFDGPDGPLLTRSLSLRWAVPPLRARSAASRRHLVLQLCAGRVVGEELLERLVGQPWWRGEVSALEAWISVLRLAPPGLITEGALPPGVELLPYADGSGPLILMTHAAIDEYSGEVVGQTRTLDAGAALLGRGRSPWLSPPADPISAERRRWLDQALGGARAAFVALDDVPALSRAHLLIERLPSGAALRQVPGSNGRVEVRAAGVPAWTPLGETPTLVSGGGVALRFMEMGELEPFFTAHLFDGPLSLQALGSELVEASARGPAQVTRRGGGAPPATAAAAPGPTRWTLSAVERAALVEMLLACARSGQSKAGFYKRWLSERRDVEGLERLTGFLLAEARLDRIGTYVHQRIFVDWGDALLLEELDEALWAAGDGEAVLAKLAAAIRRLLEGDRDKG